MSKPDDSTLTASQRARVRKEAERALREAGVLGVFPTPVNRIMEVAKVQEVQGEVLGESFLSKMRAKAGSALKRALSKVLGLFHASEGLIFIDEALYAVKKRFIRLHESAHGFLPWQRPMYAVVEDCEKSLDAESADTFDREANVFASEVLFQLDTFSEMASSESFGLLVPIRLSKKFDASIYSSVRQYVSKNHRPCAVLVLNKPEISAEYGFIATLRRCVVSPEFSKYFPGQKWPESFSPDDELGAMVPFGKGRRASRPRRIELTDANGVSHECVAEAFTQSHQVFILIHVKKALTAVSIFVPGVVAAA
jgi:hypothetical protein